MKVTKFPNKISKSKKTMILGSFSGFHNGHKKLLEIAKTYKNTVIMIIMESPSKLPNKNIKDFESLKTRLQQLSNINVDEVAIIHFNEEIRNTEGLDFVTRLKEEYNVERFIVGKDFAIGRNASFKAKDLQSKFKTTIVASEMIGNSKLSTTLLSEMVQLGDVDLIKKYTPFYFTLEARIKPNNLFEINNSIIPHSGLYSAWAVVNSVKYWSVVRISSTGNHELFIQDLLIKNSGYDVSIEFVKKIRMVIRKDFDNITEKDKKVAIEFLKNHL